jgi:hypothetical protein
METRCIVVSKDLSVMEIVLEPYCIHSGANDVAECPRQAGIQEKRSQSSRREATPMAVKVGAKE